MACFIAPLTQAAMTTACRRQAQNVGSSNRWIAALPKLELMLWSGTLMLIVDHIINGEVTWMYPFFTALTVSGGAQVMVREILTVGIPMCLAVTALWAVLVAVGAFRPAKA